DFKNYVSQKKNVIQYPRFTKLIIADMMKKFPSIPLRIEEDHHSIKDDIPLVSVYTTGNVNVRGMLILDAFLTNEIHATDDYKEYETGKKRKKSVGESNSPQKSLKITIRQKLVSKGEKDEQSYEVVDDSDNRLELGSHKENPEHVDDDDDKEEEKNNVIQVHSTPTTSTDTTSSADIQKQLYLKMRRSLQDRANDIALWEVLKHNFEKYFTSNASCIDDAFHSQHHNDHQDDDAPPKGEKY
ncbi:hypothetical protein Tco_0580086, partial [Tanacetum coccineum]